MPVLVTAATGFIGRHIWVRRVVQISAISADGEAGTEYALSKKAADDHLRGLDIDWVVPRPSLVYAHWSYGGTSLLHGLAGLPFFMPWLGNCSSLSIPTTSPRRWADVSKIHGLLEGHCSG